MSKCEKCGAVDARVVARPGCYRTDWEDCDDPLCAERCRYAASPLNEHLPTPGQRVRVIHGPHTGKEGRAEVWRAKNGKPYPNVTYPWQVFFDGGECAPFKGKELEPVEPPKMEDQ